MSPHDLYSGSRSRTSAQAPGDRDASLTQQSPGSQPPRGPASRTDLRAGAGGKGSRLDSKAGGLPVMLQGQHGP